MIVENQDYSLFYQFIETFAPGGFKNIDRNHSLLQELEEITEANNQFFHVADLIQAKVIWASKRSSKMIGIDPEELNAFHFIEATHPDDLYKHSLGREKMFAFANDIYRAGKGNALLSINIRIRNSDGEYPDLLFQLYFFYSEVPHKSCFLFQVHTDISSFKHRKDGYHYYVGNDFSNFRYPDDNLLKIGNPLSNREFEIIKLIASGLNSEQVAEKIFVSPFTINTHRRNILLKTGKDTIAELIFDFKDQGLL